MLLKRISVIAIALVVSANDTHTVKAIENAKAATAKLQTVKNGDSKIETDREAALALQTNPSSDLMQTLAAMNNATPIGRNWLSGVASSQWSQALQKKADAKTLKPQLEKWLDDQSNNAEARTLVFHWLTNNDEPTRQQRLLKMTDDSSPELRFAAIQIALDKRADDDTATLENLLQSARHPDQIRAIIKALNKLGINVDQAKHFGFIQNWQLVGPFDNRDEAHFDTVYPVEQEIINGDFDANKSYIAKDSKTATWKSYTGEEEEGKINLAEIFDKEKGAVIYATTIFNSDQATDAQLRVTSINANKAWFNGELILSNGVYHAGTRLDQYIGDINLRRGENRIVVKILQNEQTEGWAQDYQFHVRVTDLTGKGIDGTEVIN